MSRYNKAYNETVGDLKQRIAGIASKRLRKPAQDPTQGGEHEEPDGDEDAEGMEPPGPEEKTYGHGMKAIELPEDDAEMELEPDERKPFKAQPEDDMNCNGCGAPGDSEDTYCRHCGGKR